MKNYGTMPRAGGLYDQYAQDMEAFSIIAQAESRHNKEQANKRNKKGNNGKRSKTRNKRRR